MTAIEKWPMLAKGLRQMRRDGCERSLKDCEEHPEAMLFGGAIADFGDRR